MEQQFQQPEQTSAALQDDTEEQPQPSRRRGWIIAILVLAVLIGALYFIFFRDRGTTPTDVVVTPPEPLAELRSPTVAGAIVSARGDGTLVLPYRNEQLRFSLEFPIAWEGYRVTETPSDNRLLVTFEFPQPESTAVEDGRVAFTVYAYAPGVILPTDVRMIEEANGILYAVSLTKAARGVRTNHAHLIPSILQTFKVLPPVDAAPDESSAT